jgi:site-specific DNA-methyltransferase (adenine-specific)
MILKNGNCLELMNEIPDNSIDLILCDLPYGTTECKWDSIIPFDSLWEQYERITKINAAIVLFASQPFTTHLIQSNIKNYRYNWYWKKSNATGGQFAKVQPMRCMEDICVFYRKKPLYNPQGLIKIENPEAKITKNSSNIYRWRGDQIYIQKYKNYPKNLLEFAKDKQNFHPTQKPIKLLEYLIKTYTNEGETVLDNCMGSGSTGVACVNTNRNFIGFELNKKYFDIAEHRINSVALSLS